MRALFTLQYLGTRYAGWQTQTNATAIQSVFEAALARLFQTTVRVEGAGRTDSGVHAREQKAHADLPFPIDALGLQRGLNDLLPADIRVASVEIVADDFHCRFRAKAKTYLYQIWNAPFADVFTAETHAHVPMPLDAARMNSAAKGLVGEHDFAAFTVASPEVSSTVRTLESIAVARTGQMVSIVVTADGFLRYMVRRIAGSLIEIDRGRIEPAMLAQSLEPSFEPARWTAPARGLTLWEIRY